MKNNKWLKIDLFANIFFNFDILYLPDFVPFIVFQIPVQCKLKIEHPVQRIEHFLQIFFCNTNLQTFQTIL